MIKETSRRSKQSSAVDASPNEKQQYDERIRELERQNKASHARLEELMSQCSHNSHGGRGGSIIWDKNDIYSNSRQNQQEEKW
ncbi:kinesin-like protein KIN-4C [Senna tora]|uniref:Kinesin-like protein KIN-4C n=1 Tax=Senna tora TaxID=362788 RepID=A0A834T333_9FABA|nr:kinesin-like protein KIN-4C [Senna tora]